MSEGVSSAGGKTADVFGIAGCGGGGGGGGAGGLGAGGGASGSTLLSGKGAFLAATSSCSFLKLLSQKTKIIEYCKYYLTNYQKYYFTNHFTN